MTKQGLALVAVGLALCCPGGARPAPSARELALLRRVRGGGRLGGFPGAVGAFGRAVGDGIKEETSGGNSINDEDGVPPKSGGGSGAGAGHVTESHSSTRSHSSRTSRLDNVSGDGAVAGDDLLEAAPADSEAAELGDDGPVSLEMVEDAYQSISPENQAELLRLAAQSVQDGFNQLPAEDRNSLKGYVFDRVPESTRADVLDLLQRVKHAEERQAARDAEAAAVRDEQEREERGSGGGGGSAAAQQYGSAAPASEAEMQAVMATYQMPPEVTAALVRRHLLNTLLVNVPYVLLTNMFAAVGSMAGLALVRRFIAGGSVQQAKKRGQEKPVTFKDVVGCDEAKEEVRQVVDFLQSPEKYAKLGATVPRGILLCGPPGTGKTLLAKACAGEAGVPFLYSCGSDYNGMYAGQGVALVKQQFAAARKHKKAIIFIDELDYVGKRRSSGTNGQQSLALDRESTLTQLLAEMDGFSPNDGIVVIATTNRGDMLDPALLRSGRFGTSVEVEAPDRLGRQQLFARYLAAMSVTPDADTLSAIASAAAAATATATGGTSADQPTTAAAAGALTAANALATLTTAAAAPTPSSTTAADRNVQRSAARRLPLQLLHVGGRIALVVLGAPLAPLAMHHLALRRRAVAAHRAAAAAAAEAAGAAAGGADGAPSAEAVRWAMAGELAGLTPGFVGADIEQVCNVAAMSAAKAGSDAISRGDLSNAIDRVWNGLEKRSKLVKPHERQRTAIHEAGHAVVGWRLPHADVVNKVSIVWRGSALGFTQSLPDERLNSLRGHYLDKVCVCLGGRAAEALCLGDVSDGASSDLSTATRIIKEMIMRLGFGSSIGLFAPSDWSALSELTSQKIEQEIQTILEEQYERAKALVAANMEPLRALERLLLEQEVVHEAGLKALLGEKATPDDNNTSTAAATLLPASSASAPDAGAAPPKAAAAPATAEPAEEELAGRAVLAMRGGAGRRE